MTTEGDNEPPSFDVHQTKVPQVVWYVGPCYNGLVHHNPLDPSRIIGDLAENWELSPDGKVYTFHFHKEVTWHDGRAFTSEDARYSITRMWKPPEGTISGWKEAFAGVERVEAPDTTTLKILLEYPRSSLLPYLASAIYMMPKHILERKGSTKWDVVGTGPFRNKTYISGSYFAVEKNPSYFKKGRPYLDGIVRYILKDASTRLAALRTGQVLQTGEYSSALLPPQAEIIKKEMPDRLMVGTLTPLLDFRVIFNCLRPPFDDSRVRQAVSLAMDRRNLIATVSQGYGKVGSALVPGTDWAVPQEEIERTPGFREPKDTDIAEAKRLLAEAGYAGGLKVGFMVRTATLHKRFAEVLKHQLGTTGVDLAIEVVEPTIWMDRSRRLAYQASMKGFVYSIPDPDAIFADYLCSNRDNDPTGFCDQEVDELFKRQSRSLDLAERKKIVQDIDRKIVKLAPRAAGYWPESLYGASRRVMDYKPPIGGHNNPKFEVVWLSP